MDVTRGAAGELVIRIDGTFDRQAASRLNGWLGEVPRDAPVVLDFSRVRELQDLGLAAVAGALAGLGGVQVLGLGWHQQRLLRYFGVDMSKLGAGLRGDEEVLG
ncbi:STAS domain-containing protein [Anaeromyxobacter oryzisoli]|uniref:STAS domain-containing protein n=1 Tax=Anaeromyxobacter oryzisoli TaxID=2925408 RepID=UPI001F5828B5|nr:STAS domain-containing protein [Anaeromyxobacter sp. SG63]